ncbi:phosphonate metabolism protein/1,5-bisphosphokinase (PRPP-forming) PhnN [Niveibacterium sp. 24ML]|uniref:phosphonate metabolism protein/1,5-bisphosphokinase (PRPP-forming) PhnN n=1 Tax=Niveibacterium sp. 24ML TaxID=2985512 RepID=UPI002270C5BB|nr:phosphonate metabolism protein/1,5-bisphosphokinase (PRPP-forming) PhnN [Niveibacterium sp. 24ML]MCX9156076.1 phosphonate metabolism protein/1,5-bisphosphokinase (PRPP-forming) PhnN [Niveibacterium sp. 24ML]
MSGTGLVYVVGASGVGKDSVLASLRTLLQDDDRIAVAHRYITREAQCGSENHIALSQPEFLQRRAAGCFALSWESHGLYYGIGTEIELWLKRGLRVLINGSRAHVDAVRERYPTASVVEIVASESIVRQRLLARGREDLASVEARLARNRQLVACPADLRIANEASLHEAAQALLSVARQD